jgi:hypothetical protein
VGVPTGSVNGFDVLDVDTKDGKGGEAWLALFEASHGFPITRTHATRSGGLHFFFQHRPGLRCSEGLIAPGVDVRSTGGYVILWPAAGYRVLSAAPIAPWPGALIAALHEAEEAKRASYTMTANQPMGASLMTRTARQGRGEVSKPLYDKTCELMPGSTGHNRRRALGILRGLEQQTSGRNEKLFKSAISFRGLIADDIIKYEAAEQLLLMAATLNGYVAKRGEAAALRTIRSGLRPVINEAPSSYVDAGEPQ